MLHARGPARLSVYAVADKFHKRALRTFLDAHPSLEEAGARWFPDDVLYWRWDAAASAALGLPANGGGGECFVFASTGVVAVWGLPSVQYDRAVLALLAPAAASPLDAGEVESDELQFQVSGSEQPSVSNDVITIAAGSLNTTAIKLAISHVRCVHDARRACRTCICADTKRERRAAVREREGRAASVLTQPIASSNRAQALAQSTKLALYEHRIMENVTRTAHIPHDLARTGAVHLSRTEILKLIGVLFTQKAEVNILSPLLDTPAYFWTAPDRLQALYKSLCVYLELESRVTVVNARLNVMEDMLGMLQDTVHARHSQKLEMIVIVLILVEVLVGCLQCAEMLGLIGKAS